MISLNRPPELSLYVYGSKEVQVTCYKLQFPFKTNEVCGLGTFGSRMFILQLFTYDEEGKRYTWSLWEKDVSVDHAPWMIEAERRVVLTSSLCALTTTMTLTAIQCFCVVTTKPPSLYVFWNCTVVPDNFSQTMEPGEATEEKTMSAAQRRAENRRRKLLMNSEDRMNRIVGYTKNGSENHGRTSVLGLQISQNWLLNRFQKSRLTKTDPHNCCGSWLQFPCYSRNGEMSHSV